MGNNINRKEAHDLQHEAMSELVLGGGLDDELIRRLYIVSRLNSVLEFLEDTKED